ncbi:MAG: glycosyltransferase [Thermomicrobium sp.]|nr:glycosyltransferase [Thermomicrobium sp.]
MQTVPDHRDFFPATDLQRVAMLSVHTSPLAQPGVGSAGGMNVYIRELSRHLAERGVEVDIFTRRDDPATPPIVEPMPGVRVYTVEAGPPTPVAKDRLFCYLPSFVSEVAYHAYRDRRTYDVIHAHYWLSGWAAYLLQRYWGVPFVQMFHTLAILKNAASSGTQESVLRLQVEQGLARVADAIIAANPEERATIERELGAPKSSLCTVPPGVDAEHFRPLDRVRARAALALEPGRPIALFVGRIDPVKGIGTLLAAWRLVVTELAPARPLLLFLGGTFETGPAGSRPDPALARVIAEARRSGLGESIRFLGSRPREELPLYYNAADLCLIPSLYESFGLVAVEAMACGTPVVASHVGGLRFSVEHEVSGLHVPPGDPDALAAATVRGLTDHALRSRLQVGARQAALRYSWHRVTTVVARVYERVARRETLQPCCSS